MTAQFERKTSKLVNEFLVLAPHFWFDSSSHLQERAELIQNYQNCYWKKKKTNPKHSVLNKYLLHFKIKKVLVEAVFQNKQLRHKNNWSSLKQFWRSAVLYYKHYELTTVKINSTASGDIRYHDLSCGESKMLHKRFSYLFQIDLSEQIGSNINWCSSNCQKYCKKHSCAMWVICVPLI